MARLAAEPAKTIAFLQKKLSPVPVLDRDRVVQWLTEQDSDDVAVRRQAWRDRQPALEPRRLEFVDETWARSLAVSSQFACT